MPDGTVAQDGTATQDSTGAAVQAVELAVKAATAYRRPDLAARAGQALQRLHHPLVRVLVVGEFKQGKSMLVNALVNAPICPIDDDVSTSVPTVVRYAESPSVTLVRSARHRRWRGRPARAGGRAGNPGRGPGHPAGRSCLRGGQPRQPRGPEVRRSRGSPADPGRWPGAGGHPGVGGLGSVHGSATVAMLPSADAILLVSDAAAEYSRPELEFLRQAGRVCPNVACVLTKIDLYPQWQRIAELDRGHLTDARIDAELLPASSVLRLHAVSTEDRQLNTESGFPALVTFLRDRVVGRAGQLANRAAANDVVTITAQLAAGLRAELAACTDPIRPVSWWPSWSRPNSGRPTCGTAAPAGTRC